jgi:NADP-dependent 3-hydroxy acid dehydrogenase YdfG
MLCPESLFMNKSITPKNILVIGGGTGMGRAIALQLCEEGNRVAIAGRREGKLTEVAETSLDNIKVNPVDVTDRVSVANLFLWFDQNIGKLDVLINAAGVNTANRTIQDLDPSEWDKLIQINLTGAYNCMREALKKMRPTQSGLIISINSVAGKRAIPLAGVAYNASKFGMSALGVSVGEEERENGIRITNIYPGEVNTPILDERLNPPTPEHRESILQPSDMADVVSTVVKLPARAHVPELVIKPSRQSFV